MSKKRLGISIGFWICALFSAGLTNPGCWLVPGFICTIVLVCVAMIATNKTDQKFIAWLHQWWYGVGGEPPTRGTNYWK